MTMPRPINKQQLLDLSEENFSKLLALINSMSIDEQERSFSFEDRDKNIRDVLVHLYEWHQLLLNWLSSNLSGQKMNFLPDPYNWKTYPEMNIVFWGKHQSTSLEKSISLLKKSHLDVMRMIDAFTDEQLFTKRFFPWTGTTSLGSYCVSATSSHYDWGIKKIRKHIKGLTVK